MGQRYDAVIIGGGHNGLVSAAYLARAGMKTLVLEQRHVLGGAAVTEELFPGFRFSVFSYVVSLLRPEIIRDLQLPRHGLDILPLDGTFTPLRPGDGPQSGGGDYLWRVNDHGRTVRELRRWSATDAEAYEEYGQLMVEMARFIKPILGITPPDLTSLDPRPMLPLASLARRFQQLPQRQQAVFVQLMTMSAVGLSRPVVRDRSAEGDDVGVGDHRHVSGRQEPGNGVRPAPPLHGRDRRRVPGVGDPEGRYRRDQQRDRGCGASARGRDPDGGAASRTSSSRAVARSASRSNPARRSSPIRCCPRSTRGRRSCVCSSPGTLDASFEDEVRRFKFRGSSGKVNMAVDRLPDFTALPGVGEHLRGAISFSPSIDEMETAYDDAKYGHFSRKPYIDMIIPTLVDPSMAPPGKHVISCFVQYAPYQLAPELGRGTTSARRSATPWSTASPNSRPNIRDIILFRNVQTPLDIERTTGLSEGNIFQGELSLEQLFFNRPVPGYARFRTPVRDLWLCGSATHPGGGIMGANGRIAALEVLRARGRKVA